MIFIIVNGPPQSGKTAITWELFRMLIERHPTVVESFAAPMKHFLATALGTKYAELAKDQAMAVLAGYTPREFLIDLSENYIKPRYGQDAYGRWLLNRVLRVRPAPAIVLVDDCGFPEELAALGEQRTILVRVNRPGKDFTNDSRAYLPDPHWTINNTSTIDELWVTCRQLVTEVETELTGGAQLTMRV